MRIPIIAGNWKLNKTLAEARTIAQGVVQSTQDVKQVKVVLCPPFTALETVNRVIAGTHVFLGAQDVFWEEKGAFTGEVSSTLLKDLGCNYVIIGHSERRQYFGETNETVNRKVKAALALGLTPIMCVGETLPEREAGQVQSVVSSHVRGGLAGLRPEAIAQMVIAYEPVWAIGTGKNATPEQAQEVHHFIRILLAELSTPQIAETVIIQYGGSVKPDNIRALMEKSDIDGALVGGASLQIDSFGALVKYQTK